MKNEVKIKIPRSAFNEIYLPYLECSKRYLILYGGAGSGKSMFAVQRFLFHILKRKMMNLLVVRAVGNTNRDSTFSLFKQVISRWGLEQYFQIYEGDMRIRCLLNKNEIIFKGLDNTEKLKSITFSRGELTDIWIEEASEIAEADFNQLDIRLRGRGIQKQIVLSFNPVDANHWLKKRFFDRKSENAAVLHTTYRDNAFLGEEDAKLLESYRESDPYYYQVYCLGEWGVFGKSVFDALKVNSRLSAVRGISARCGYFLYDYDGTNIRNIRFFDDENGYIHIYQEPQPGHPYVIGGDTAGDGSDYFVGQVLDNATGIQAATLRHEFDEDVYAQQIYCLGYYYNDALVGIEANYSSYPIKELQRLGYYNQYYRETVDRISNRPLHKYGYVTNGQTRPVLIAGLVRLVREHPELLNDADTLNEMLTFVRNERGRPEAKAGAHDDCVMALGIAEEIREQQRGDISSKHSRRGSDNRSIMDFIGYEG